MAGSLQHGHAIGAMVLGAIEVVCGLIIIIISVVMTSKAEVRSSMSPWWAGVVFAIPGILGIVVGCTKNHGAMIAFMVLNIIAFVIQGIGAILVGLIIAVWAGIVADATKNCTKSGYGSTCTCRHNGESFTIDVKDNDCDIVTQIAAMATAVVVFLVIAAITSLAASILGCVSVCCSRNQPGAVVYEGAPPPVYQQQQKY